VHFQADHSFILSHNLGCHAICFLSVSGHVVRRVAQRQAAANPEL
jgi:hypothetical protein